MALSVLSLLGYYMHTLICTISATSFKELGSAETINCNRMGCECHVLGDPQYKVLVSLVMILALAAVILTFGPQTPQSPLMAESSVASGRSSPVSRSQPAGDPIAPSSTIQQVCIECGHPVASLYTEYGIGHIRLTQCENCKSFADKYVEHDVVIVFIDMLLHKPQVYRHLLVNKLEFRQPFMEKNVTKLCILLILFSVYIDWFRLEEGGRLRNQSELLFGKQHSFAVQYLFILVLAAVDAVLMLAGILLASIIHQRSFKQVKRWATIATALTISSFGKVLMIMLVIWEYNESYYPWLLDFLLFTSYSTAMSVLFDIHALWACLMVVFGMATKQLAHLAILSASSAVLA
ncbi:sterol homeostasis protein [Coemansia spiralis]|uniref:Protein ARV n=2 Tax=Coemansia TaxID=4863 RepID=A0A9W8G1R3_9FUNG|nr:sterol homeostasis protein [Coemansia umbellata]KAJ2619312.1 sterol homeostasis protein [Coemansia sp. RSA 1358]KAJ2670218.1 sterol homeostasis protein [Coemansia spiralis]